MANQFTVPFRELRNFTATIAQRTRAPRTWREIKKLEPEVIATVIRAAAEKASCPTLKEKFFNSYIVTKLTSHEGWHLETRWQAVLKAAFAQNNASTELILDGVIRWLKASNITIQSYNNRTLVTGNPRQEEMENRIGREIAIGAQLDFLYSLTETSYLKDGLKEGHTDQLQTIFKYYLGMPSSIKQIAAEQCGIELSAPVAPQ